MAALQTTPYSFLPTLVLAQPLPLFDLRFRSDTKLRESEATLYVGERASLRLIARSKGALRLGGPTTIFGAASPEGVVHAAVASRPENAVLDRECAFRFDSTSNRASTLDR